MNGTLLIAITVWAVPLAGMAATALAMVWHQRQFSRFRQVERRKLALFCYEAKGSRPFAFATAGPTAQALSRSRNDSHVAHGDVSSNSKWSRNLAEGIAALS
jgi:hypothetical protein